MSRRQLRLLPALASAASFVVLARYFWIQIGDDAFIYFRYAVNLASGNGPVWNPGGPPVEGFSSPLWLALLTLGELVGVSLADWARLLGVGFAALAVAGVFVLARRLGAGEIAAGLASLASTLVYGLQYWAPGGLETPLYAAAVTWTLAELAGGSRWRWAIPACAVGLGRPEGPFILALAVAGAGLLRGRKALGAGPLLIACGPTAAYLAFRLAYYGVPLPNTFYAKAGGGQPEQFIEGIRQVLFAPPAWLACALGWAARRSAERRAALVALGLLAALLLAVAAGGRDWMWHERLLVPVLLPLLALASPLGRKGGTAWNKAGLLACVCLVLLFSIPPWVLTDALRGRSLDPRARQEGLMTDVAEDVAGYIRDHYPPGSLVAVNHAGAVPFYLGPGYTCLDMAGLSDAHIGREVKGALHDKYDAAYVLSRKPRLFVLNSEVRPGTGGIWYHPGYWKGESALLAENEFREGYRPVQRYWAWEWAHEMGAVVQRYIILAEANPAKAPSGLR